MHSKNSYKDSQRISYYYRYRKICVGWKNRFFVSYQIERNMIMFEIFFTIFFGNEWNLIWFEKQQQKIRNPHNDFPFKVTRNIYHSPTYTQRNLFEILLPFSDWFGKVNGHCPFVVSNQFKNGKHNMNSVWFNNIKTWIGPATIVTLPRFPWQC